MPRSNTWLVLLTCASLLGSPASGQTIWAHAQNGETSQPLFGALAYLLDEDGAVVRRMLTDRQGRVPFGRSRPGRYRVRVEMLGMATETSELFDARRGAIVRQDVRLSPRPLLLEGLAVVVGERCRIRPQEGLLVSQVWDEARKALSAVEFTDRRGGYRYEMLLYERDVDPETWVIRREEQSRKGGRLRTPFESKPAEELAENGFAQSGDGETLYYAPDAGVLLSDVFLDSHCFRLERGPESEEASGLIGLAFEPSEGERSMVDIAGTLWLDPATSELRWLEYRYENLDPDIASDSVGGRVDFRRMPQGTWIIPEWWIRVPQVAVGLDMTGDLRTIVTGFHQSGGRVIDIEDGAGRSPVRTRSATLEGLVEESPGNSPLRDVRVEIVGMDPVLTDAEGRFRIVDLAEGVYEVRFVDPRLEAMGFSPEPITREMQRGEVTSVVFRMPSPGELLLDACQAEPSPGPVPAGTAVLAGWVQDSRTGEPLAGATVRVGWDSYELWPGIDWMGFITSMKGYEATSDNRGFYRICGVPEKQLLTVVGAFDGIAAGDTLRIGESGPFTLHTVEVPRVRR